MPEFVDNQELQFGDMDQANYKTKDELTDLFTKSIPVKSRICSSKTKECSLARGGKSLHEPLNLSRPQEMETNRQQLEGSVVGRARGNQGAKSAPPPHSWLVDLVGDLVANI
ncbi:hypothetical protein RND71_003191 [Anisodus tanguticus]|uniref:Uncharacterized protein n=1 Tax=Anisodus tanguticus TaxID=243964 RepID=A0AAE1SW71_9SOLA|nr:hypothetical protein RND71_003191 [Anisodus tanguticus]